MTRELRPNQVLRACLAELGWSPERLARRITKLARARGIDAAVSDKAPYHWLNGARPRRPVEQLAADLLSAHLGRRITPADLGWAAAAPPDAGKTRQEGGEPWDPAGMLAALEETLAAPRAGAASAAVSAPIVFATAQRWELDVDRLRHASAQGYADARVIGELGRIIDAQRHMDDLLGGGDTLRRMVAEELRLALSLLTGARYSEGDGRRLWGLAAQMACLIGWLYFDSGHSGKAQQTWMLALRAAQLSGDRSLGAHVMLFLGEQAADAKDLTGAIGILELAGSGARGALGSAQQAALSGRLARCYAQARQAHQAEQAADRAFGLLAGTRPGEGPAWAYWCDEADLNLVVGEAYLALRSTRKAISHLDRALAGFGTRPREQMLATTALARAYLAVRELEPAMDMAREAAAVAPRVSSWQAHHAVADLCSVLRQSPLPTAPRCSGLTRPARRRAVARGKPGQPGQTNGQ